MVDMQSHSGIITRFLAYNGTSSSDGNRSFTWWKIGRLENAGCLNLGPTAKKGNYLILNISGWKRNKVFGIA